jgi:hypothetical protein
LLETDWFPRSLYGFAQQDVGDVLRKLAGLPSVELEDASAVAQALAWLDAGTDFADGLHLASRGKASSFATFDERFAMNRQAGHRDAVALIPKNKGRLFLTKKQPFSGVEQKLTLPT